MKQSIVCYCIFMLLSHFTFAQDSKEDKTIEKWFDAGEYDKVIAHKAPKNVVLSDFYYRLKALSYSEKEDLDNAFNQIELAIKAKPNSFKNYHVKAYIQYQKKQTQSAIKTLDMGIKKDSSAYQLWELKGLLLEDANKMEEAKVCYRKCISLEPENIDFRLELVKVYMGQDSLDLAMTLLTDMENDKRWDEKDKYQIMMDKSKIYLLKKDYDNAKMCLEILYKENGNDAQTMQNLMQICNRQNQLKEALKWRENIYKSYNAKALETDKNYFIFETFAWKEYQVVVVEYYDQKKDSPLEVKHKFVFYDKNDEAEFRVQSESSVAVRMSKKEYVLCKVDERGYHTFWQFTFGENPNYKELKEAVLKIAEGKLSPTAETITK